MDLVATFVSSWSCVAQRLVFATVAAVVAISVAGRCVASHRELRGRGQITRGCSGAVAERAETYRKAIAKDWLGKEMPPWSQPCPVKVKVTTGRGRRRDRSSSLRMAE